MALVSEVCSSNPGPPNLTTCCILLALLQ